MGKSRNYRGIECFLYLISFLEYLDELILTIRNKYRNRYIFPMKSQSINNRHFDESL